jgi:hypothetical protein
MFLEAGTRAHFMQFLAREFPASVPRYERLYARKYAPEEYRAQVKAMVRVLQARYGLAPRERETTGPAPADGPEQVGFAW